MSDKQSLDLIDIKVASVNISEPFKVASVAISEP